MNEVTLGGLVLFGTANDPLPEKGQSGMGILYPVLLG